MPRNHHDGPADRTQADWQLHDLAGRRKYLTVSELARFLAIADRSSARRRALFYVLAFTGCRISEALALNPYQLDPDAGTLTFRTLKRRRLVYRTVPIPELLVAMLLASPFKATGAFWPINRSTAWRWVKAAMQRATVAGPMSSPKGLRHGFGARAISKNIPLPLIQRWMGHARLTTTAIYLQVVDEEERRFASRMW